MASHKIVITIACVYGGGEEFEEAARGMLASLSAFTVSAGSVKLGPEPPRGAPAAFHEAAGYYGTLIHEAAHGSGAKHRLDRDFHERFRCDVLAIEEATAELAASFVSGANGRHEQTLPSTPCGLQAPSTAFQAAGAARP